MDRRGFLRAAITAAIAPVAAKAASLLPASAPLPIAEDFGTISVDLIHDATVGFAEIPVTTNFGCLDQVGKLVWSRELWLQARDRMFIEKIMRRQNSGIIDVEDYDQLYCNRARRRRARKEGKGIRQLRDEHHQANARQQARESIHAEWGEDGIRYRGTLR